VACAQVGPYATPPNRTGGAIARKLCARLYSLVSPRGIPFEEVLSLSLRAHIEVFGSAAATKCSGPRRCPLFQTFKENATGARVSWRQRSQKPLYALLS
jgi:hypothetical protein